MTGHRNSNGLSVSAKADFVCSPRYEPPTAIGPALRAKTAGSRERDRRLKALTHNAMILEALSDRIETGKEGSSFQKK
jgi:hypothetical protein